MSIQIFIFIIYFLKKVSEFNFIINLLYVNKFKKNF